jgi:hypothetical protein
MEFDWTQGALAEGLRRYDAGEFFAAHEAWETVWLEALEPDKTFLQGLIQVTAAFHHLQRKNPLGTRRLLHAALGRLEPYSHVSEASPLQFSVATLGSVYKRLVRAKRRQNLLAPEYYPLPEPGKLVGIGLKQPAISLRNPPRHVRRSLPDLGFFAKKLAHQCPNRSLTLANLSSDHPRQRQPPPCPSELAPQRLHAAKYISVLPHRIPTSQKRSRTLFDISATQAAP